TACGIKTVENIAVDHWLTNGVQGYIISVVQQGKTLGGKKIEKYIPKPHRGRLVNHHNGGKIISIQMWTGPCAPTASETREGWYQPISPQGSNSSFHRCIWTYQFPTPIEPISNKYILMGG